ncbi:MAG: aminotransferase class I/II-fold pyridoxal phosphate-dependent enzyme [candidate division Zixibacteria bacterium]|nr:aminotransferase class I/II-fold pyridoxal phosphate-dependent enzyme [candidate division Zixibacteria bacterium]
MNKDNKAKINRTGLSRRKFLGLAAAGSALSMANPSALLARSAPAPINPVLTDYVGRLCYNENPLGPSPMAIQAMSDDLDMSHRYPDWFAESLKGDLADIHDVSDNNVIAGCGATEILRLCAFAFAESNGNVVAPNPSYSQFPADAGFLGSDVYYSSLNDDHRIDLNDMADRVDNDTTAVCITNPNNPTATVLAADDIEAFVDDLPQGVVTIIDEAYHDFVDDPNYESAIDLVRRGKNVVVIRTFSKAYGLAGARIGYGIGRQSRINDMRAWQIFSTVSRPSLNASRAALDDIDHINDTVTLNNQAKQYCFGYFDLWGLSYIPSQTNFFMVATEMDNSDLAAALSSRDFYVRYGWGMDHHIRVSTGTMEEMEGFIDAMYDILNQVHAGGYTIPLVTALDGNYPNPFNSTTRISYSIAKSGQVKIQIFNIRGQLVKTVVDSYLLAGKHAFEWSGINQQGAPVASGSYFYRMTAGDFAQTRRMILVK